MSSEKIGWIAAICLALGLAILTLVYVLQRRKMAGIAHERNRLEEQLLANQALAKTLQEAERIAVAEAEVKRLTEEIIKIDTKLTESKSLEFYLSKKLEEVTQWEDLSIK